MDGWDVARVVQDGDGDYPFRSGTTACYADLLRMLRNTPSLPNWPPYFRACWH